jgi:SAM-dependent methyltransferase
MDSDHTYYNYLNTRTSLAKYYRKFYLYHRINRNLAGLVLDVGCGIGDFLNFRKNTYGIDINEHLVEHCKNQGLVAYSFKNGKMPFNDNLFDGVLLDNVMEHIEDPTELLIEISRVIKKNGTLIIGVPGIKGYNADSDHKIFYGESKLIDCLIKFGFNKKRAFYAPLMKSDWLSKNISQYCLYLVFISSNS